jgi:hypothetical protein
MSDVAEEVLILLDSQNRRLGQMTVDRREGGLLLGKFAPGPDFPAVRSLFCDFEEAVNSHALSVVDELDTALSALGMFLQSPDGTRRLTVHDVQIWSDGGITCRLSVPSPETTNGSLDAAKSVQPVPK